MKTELSAPVGNTIRERRRRIVATSGALLFGSYAWFTSSATSAQTYDVAVPLPAATDITDVVLAAQGNLRVEQFSNVEGGSHSRIVNMGSLFTGVSVSSTTGDVLSVAGVTVEIATIKGNVTSEHAVIRAPFSTVTGTIQQNTSIGRSTGPALHVQFPSTSNGSLNVLPLQTKVLSPGRYDALNVSPGGTLSLTAGQYFFDAYVIDPAATVLVDESGGIVEIYVRTTIQHMGKYKRADNAPPNVFVGFFGSVPAYVGAAFPGTVIAPNAQLVIGTQLGGTTHVGAFFGQGIEVLPFTTIKHRATNKFGVGLGNAVIPTTYKGPPLDPNPVVGAPMSATYHATGPKGPYYDGLKSLPADPAHGVAPAQYCDANNNPLPTPTDAQLNAPPPAGSTCAAVAGNTQNCPVIASGGLCVTDSDCSSGQICAARCIDSGCAQVEHRCGQQAASCAALPQETNCQDLWLCPEPGAVGTATPDATAAQLGPTTTSVAPTAQVLPSEKGTLSGSFQALSGAICTGPASVDYDKYDQKYKNQQDGKQDFGVYLAPSTDFHMKPTVNATGVTELGLTASGGVTFGGIAFKKKFEVMNMSAIAAIDDCGVKITAALKLFGETVASITPNAGKVLNLATDPNGQSAATDTSIKNACTTARAAQKKAVQDVRKAYLFGRLVKDFYNTNGMTSQLCNQIQSEVENPVLDTDGKPYACGAPGEVTALASIPQTKQLDIVNAWKKEYDGKTQIKLGLDKTMLTARQAISVSGSINLFDTPHPYHVFSYEYSIPVSFIIIDGAVEVFGSWNVSGALQFGVGVDGNFKNANKLVDNLLTGTTPRLGDVRAFAGPTISPYSDIGVIFFLGAGIPGVSVGVEGKINLLSITLPTNVSVSLMRVSSPDARDRTGTPYAGPTTDGLPPLNYRWVQGVSWNSLLQLKELNGELGLAVRVNVAIFKKTWKKKLFSWNGFEQTFTLISGGAATDPVNGADDYGTQGDDIAYTDIVPFDSSTPIRDATSGATLPTCLPPPVI